MLWTNQTPNVPNINAVAPWCFQAHFWRPIDVWLHILVMLDIPRNSRAKVAQKRLPDALAGWGVKHSGGIDGVPLHFFAGGWVLLFGLDEVLDDRFVLDSQKNVPGTDVCGQ